jgi:hypothetical protein
MKKSAAQLVPLANVPAPATPKHWWRDFKRFVDCADELEGYRRELRTTLRSAASGDIEDHAEYCRDLVAICRAGRERFDRRDNYDDDGALSHAYIAKRIGIMIASFPNANPGCPEGYIRMFVEHVGAVEGLTEPALETACREIVETQKFAPAISEAMNVIKDHVTKWRSRYGAIACVEEVRLELIEVLKAKEVEQKKQRHEHDVKIAIQVVENMRAQTQRLVQQIEVAKTKLTEEIEAAKTRLASLERQHAEAERHESDAVRRLRSLTAADEEPIRTPPGTIP